VIGPNHNKEDLKVLGVSGSLRKGSYNIALLRAAQALAPEGMVITIFDLKDIPLYNGDVEAEGDPEPVFALKSAIRAADGVLFATPEYNYSTSGVLKNAIDWASRDHGEGSLEGKPVTVIGAGGMAGTGRAQMQLESILSETGALVMVKPGVLVAGPWHKFDEVGRLIDKDTGVFLGRHLAAFAQWIRRVGVRLEALVAQE
jgi:chromate reductase, NAD(P)H dehydrogenase (quinone)